MRPKRPAAADGAGRRYPSFREALPPRSYFTDEIAASCRALWRGGILWRRPDDPRHHRPRIAGQAARALRKGLEKYDRGLGRLARHRQDLRPGPAGSEAWRAALAAVEVPRDIEGWFPAVVLEVGERDAASASRASRPAISSRPRM
jgi:penicillin-binding protein 1A